MVVAGRNTSYGSFGACLAVVRRGTKQVRFRRQGVVDILPESGTTASLLFVYICIYTRTCICTCIMYSTYI